jgi:putative PIN family toxin of toxin-antitoxin system
VVFDTNVVIRFFLSRYRNRASLNRTIFELWLRGNRLELIVSAEIVREYLEMMDEVIALPEAVLKRWERRLLGHKTKVVSPRKRIRLSRDPDDNIFLSVAAAGKADFLITNDRDLLEITEADKRRLKFEIVTPQQFLERLENFR